MKKIINIQSTISSIVDGSKITIDDKGTELPVKRCLIDALTLATKLTPIEAVRAWDLQKKIKDLEEDTLDIEDQDQALLLRCIEEREFIVPIKVALFISIEK